MKTNLFVTTLLLLSAGTYAQAINASGTQSAASKVTVAKTAEITASNSTNATVAAQGSEKMAAISNETIQKARQERAAAKASARNGEKQAKKEAAVATETSSAAAVTSQGQASVSAKDNKVEGDASLDSDASISAKPVTNTAKTVAVRSSNEVKTEMRATAKTVSATNARVKTTAKQAIQPKPVAIKTQARMQANGGIKIK